MFSSVTSLHLLYRNIKCFMGDVLSTGFQVAVPNSVCVLSPFTTILPFPLTENTLLQQSQASVYSMKLHVNNITTTIN